MHAYTADFISFSYNTQYYIYILSRPAHIHIFVIYSVRIVLRQSRSITACIYTLLSRASMQKCYSLRLLLTHSYVSSTYIILFESLPQYSVFCIQILDNHPLSPSNSISAASATSSRHPEPSQSPEYLTINSSKLKNKNPHRQ